MSNCIRLRKPDKPFAWIPFDVDVMNRLQNPEPVAFGESDDPHRWLDWFIRESGAGITTAKCFPGPDKIYFYIYLTTHREMRWYVSEIEKRGGKMLDFLCGDEYDGYRTTFKWTK